MWDPWKETMEGSGIELAVSQNEVLKAERAKGGY